MIVGLGPGTLFGVTRLATSLSNFVTSAYENSIARNRASCVERRTRSRATEANAPPHAGMCAPSPYARCAGHRTNVCVAFLARAAPLRSQSLLAWEFRNALARNAWAVSTVWCADARRCAWVRETVLARVRLRACPRACAPALPRPRSVRRCAFRQVASRLS
eukprot:4419539-Pleurochrysis_carterae.AAC.2